MSCENEIKSQHCAFKLLWALVWFCAISATAAMLLKIEIQDAWVYAMSILTTVAGGIDAAKYRIKKNGYHEKEKIEAEKTKPEKIDNSKPK